MNGKQTVLIVEDELIVGLDLADILEGHGYAIAGPYTNASDALERLGIDRPDAALLDVNLGQGETSADLALHLLKLGTPFVFLTGYSELDVDDARLEGVRKVGKPITPASATKVVQDLIG